MSASSRRLQKVLHFPILPNTTLLFRNLPRWKTTRPALCALPTLTQPTCYTGQWCSIRSWINKMWNPNGCSFSLGPRTIQQGRLQSWNRLSNRVSIQAAQDHIQDEVSLWLSHLFKKCVVLAGSTSQTSMRRARSAWASFRPRTGSRQHGLNKAGENFILQSVENTSSFSVMNALVSLIAEPEIDHPLRGDLAEEYQKDRKKFMKNAGKISFASE